jgi:hypothetical protein
MHFVQGLALVGIKYGCEETHVEEVYGAQAFKATLSIVVLHEGIPKLDQSEILKQCANATACGLKDSAILDVRNDADIVEGNLDVHEYRLKHHGFRVIDNKKACLHRKDIACPNYMEGMAHEGSVNVHQLALQTLLLIIIFEFFFMTCHNSNLYF